MKIAIVGLGAVGGLLAARLAVAGKPVVGLARGATLAAVRAQGLHVRDNACERSCALEVSDDAASFGPQDLVIVTVKAPAWGAASVAMQPLLGPDTIVVPAMNGVPWWFLQAAPDMPALALPEARRLKSVDPDGRIEALVPVHRVLGCVVHLSCSSPAPGVVHHVGGDRLIIGEPVGSEGDGPSARAQAVCSALACAGLAPAPSANIRRDIWFKLWGNMTMNPLSALTGATTDRLLDDPLVHAFILRTMAEAAQIGALVGCPIVQSGEERMALTRQLGGFRTSMLQDAEAGRSIELDALLGAVHEIGGRFGMSMPCIGSLLGLTRLMAQERGLYPR